MKRRYILTYLLALALLPLRAQSELVVDWTSYAQDTVVPTYVHCIDLGYDHQGRDYTVSIEYPELKPDYPTMFEFGKAFNAEIAAFIDSVKNGTPCRAPAEDGVALMKIIDAIYKSAETGREAIIEW